MILAEIKRVMEDSGTLAVRVHVKEDVWKENELKNILKNWIFTSLKWNGWKNYSNKMDLKIFFKDQWIHDHVLMHSNKE